MDIERRRSERFMRRKYRDWCALAIENDRVKGYRVKRYISDWDIARA